MQRAVARASSLASAVPRFICTVTANSRFPAPQQLTHLSSEMQERLQVVTKKAGFTPNIFRLLARRPDELEAFWAYHDILMKDSDEVTLTLTQREQP